MSGGILNEIDELGWVLGLAKPIIAGDSSDPTINEITRSLTNETAVPDETATGEESNNREPFYLWLTTFFMRFWEVPVVGPPSLYPPLYTGLLMLLLCAGALYGLWRIWRAGDAQTRFWLQLLTFACSYLFNLAFDPLSGVRQSP